MKDDPWISLGSHEKKKQTEKAEEQEGNLSLLHKRPLAVYALKRDIETDTHFGCLRHPWTANR